MAEKLNQTSIGKRIKIIRESLGQLEFAKEIGVKRNRVSGYENNNIIPSRTVLQEVFKLQKNSLQGNENPFINYIGVNSGVW